MPTDCRSAPIGPPPPIGSFSLGPFFVDETGGLSPATPDRFPAFSVIWRGRMLHLRLARAPNEATAHGLLGVQAVLGRVPSTAGRDPAGAAERRNDAFALLRGLLPEVPPGWEISLAADHSVRLSLDAALELPTTASVLVTTVTSLFLELAPYFDVLDEGGIVALPRSASEAAGTANAWPG
jgi:hypothetical protein